MSPQKRWSPKTREQVCEFVYAALHRFYPGEKFEDFSQLYPPSKISTVINLCIKKTGLPIVMRPFEDFSVQDLIEVIWQNLSSKEQQ